MKVYKHIIIVAVLVILTILLYDKGFGAVPFLLAATYLVFITIKELKRFRKSRSL